MDSIERDWQTVRRLENWVRVYAPRHRGQSAWGTPPFVAVEQYLGVWYEHDDDDGSCRVPGAQSDKKTKTSTDPFDAEKVEHALVSPLFPAAEKRLIKTFYLSRDSRWSSFGRLCRSAGTSKRKAADDLIRAEWLLGNMLRRLYDA